MWSRTNPKQWSSRSDSYVLTARMARRRAKPKLRGRGGAYPLQKTAPAISLPHRVPRWSSSTSWGVTGSLKAEGEEQATNGRTSGLDGSVALRRKWPLGESKESRLEPSLTLAAPTVMSSTSKPPSLTLPSLTLRKERRIAWPAYADRSNVCGSKRRLVAPSRQGVLRQHHHRAVGLQLHR